MREKRERIEEKTKRREDEDVKHRKRQSLGHTLISTFQTPYVTCNSPHAELSDIKMVVLGSDIFRHPAEIRVKTSLRQVSN